MGSPRALTTRPSRASPTGTDRIRPVALTDCPSSIVVDLAEDDRADGVLVEVERQAEGAALELEQLVDRRAGQARHPGDAVADLARWCRPARRRDLGGEVGQAGSCSAAAMSEASRLNVSVIWTVLRSTSRSCSRRLPHRAVDDRVARPGRRCRRGPSGSMMTLTVTFLPVALPRASARRATAGRASSGYGGAHLGDGLGAQLGGTGHQASTIAGRSWARPATTMKFTMAVVTWAARLAEEVLHHTGAALDRDGRVGQRRAQVVVGLEGAGDLEQLVLDPLDGALGFGDAEQGIGVCGRPCAVSGTGRFSSVPGGDRADVLLDQGRVLSPGRGCPSRPSRPGRA